MNDLTSVGKINGKQVSSEGYEEVLQREERKREQQERAYLRAEALLQKIGQSYDELTRLIQQFPEVGRQVTAGFGETNVGVGKGENEDAQSAQGREVYGRIRRESLALADAAPRCRWVKQDGTLCRCPQMKNDVYCFAHRQMREAHTLMLRLPAQEDANAIQIGLMQVQKALIEDRISTKKAGLLLYSMQLALQNVGQVTFGEAKDEEMLRETVTEEEAFRGIGSSDHQEIGSSENQKSTTETQRHWGEAEGLPRIDAEDRGLERQQRTEDVEFVPMPAGYGFHRVRLKIGDEGKPVQVAAADQRAEHRAKMG